MKFKAKLFELESAGKPVVVLNEDDVEELGVRSLGRVSVSFQGKERTAIINTTRRALKKGEIGLYVEVWKYLKSPENAEIVVESSPFPKSMTYIRNRLKGRRLRYQEIVEIISDMLKGNLSEVEITAFVMALEHYTIDLDEALSLTHAMVDTGEKLKLKTNNIVDKHSIGGVPGDKTTLLVVPIIAACGLTIPKSSSRAITSASGSADRAEILMNVSLGLDEMKRVVEKTNGCIVWGGSLNLAPADDIFIQVEYPLSIDPLLLPSIMSKKVAVGANRLVIDIPTGRGTKIKTVGDATLLANDFINLGQKMNMKIQCTVSYGEQPIGYTIGPALEAKEVIEVLMGVRKSADLIDKAIRISGVLLEMCGIKNGKQTAMETILNGKAEEKLREIIEEQGGSRNIKPEDIPIGDYSLDIRSEEDGFVQWIDNNKIVDIARRAGSPRDIGAGIMLHKKLGDKVDTQESLLTIYSRNATKIQRIEKILQDEPIMAVGEKVDMIIREIREMPIQERPFILER